MAVGGPAEEVVEDVVASTRDRPRGGLAAGAVCEQQGRLFVAQRELEVGGAEEVALGTLLRRIVSV